MDKFDDIEDQSRPLMNAKAEQPTADERSSNAIKQPMISEKSSTMG
jgi:hypothetical protein